MTEYQSISDLKKNPNYAEREKVNPLLSLQSASLQKWMGILMFSTCSMNYEEGIRFKCSVKDEIVTLTLTWAIPAVKAKGLRRHKVHSKNAGRCLYRAVNPRLPQKTVRRKTASPVREGFFTNTLIRKANII